jgi:hypothetical protein
MALALVTAAYDIIESTTTQVPQVAYENPDTRSSGRNSGIHRMKLYPKVILNNMVS